jgi:hypothetical protein
MQQQTSYRGKLTLCIAPWAMAATMWWTPHAMLGGNTIVWRVLFGKASHYHLFLAPVTVYTGTTVLLSGVNLPTNAPISGAVTFSFTTSAGSTSRTVDAIPVSGTAMRIVSPPLAVSSFVTPGAADVSVILNGQNSANIPGGFTYVSTAVV